MKLEHGHGWKLIGPMAVALTLGTLASAQRLSLPSGAGNLANDIREGRGPRRVENPADGGMIRVDLPQAEPGLEISWEVTPLDGSDIRGLFPLRSEMMHRLRLTGGVAGRVAVLQLAEIESAGGSIAQGYGRTILHGVFDGDGIFEVEVPATLDLSGLVARGAMLDGRTITHEVEVELEPAAEEAYISWQVLAKLDHPRGAYHGNAFQRVRQGTVPPRPLR